MPIGNGNLRWRGRGMNLQNCKIDQDTSRRLSILKFLFMVMVVYIHSDALPELPFKLEVPCYTEVCKNIVTDGICSIAIPGFFFVSGFLLFSKKFTWVSNMKKKVKSILVPYILINSFWILFFKIMQSIQMTAAWFSGEAYQIEGIEGVLNAYCNPIPLYYPFWFLRDLFILNVFARAIYIIANKFPLISLVLVIGIGLNIIVLPLLVNNASFCLFVLGYYARKYIRDVKKLDQVNIYVIAVAFLLLLLFKLYFNNQALAVLLHSVLGILFFYRLSGIICKYLISSKILWCSQFSFFIYAFHEFYEAMVKKLIMMVLPQYGFVQLLEYFILPLFVTGGCIMAGAIMKRYFRWGYCIICGHRS